MVTYLWRTKHMRPRVAHCSTACIRYTTRDCCHRTRGLPTFAHDLSHFGLVDPRTARSNLVPLQGCCYEMEGRFRRPLTSEGPTSTASSRRSLDDCRAARRIAGANHGSVDLSATTSPVVATTGRVLSCAFVRPGAAVAAQKRWS